MGIGISCICGITTRIHTTGFFSESSSIRTSDILLAGIGCTLAIGAISTGIQFTADMSETYRAVQWSLGTLSNVGYQSTYTLLLPCISIYSGYFDSSAWFNCTDFRRGNSVESGSRHLFPYDATLCLFASIGVGTCVAQCGPIAFVGLVVPHIIVDVKTCWKQGTILVSIYRWDILSPLRQYCPCYFDR